MLSNVEYEITNVKATKDFKLILEFKEIENEDRVEYRLFDAKRHLSNKLRFADVVGDINFFMGAYVIPFAGTIAWSEEIDIAVEFLYENSTKTVLPFRVIADVIERDFI